MTGEAMEPTIPDGSAILVDTATTDRRDGSIVVVRIVAAPPARGAAHHRAHLVGGVEVPCVVPALELCHVAVKVLGAHAVEDADVGPLEHRPEALDPVGGDLASGELPETVAHALVVLERSVAARLVGVELGVPGHVCADEDRGGGRALDHGGPNLLRLLVLHADDANLADRPAHSTALDALPLVHVLDLAPDVGLVGLDGGRRTDRCRCGATSRGAGGPGARPSSESPAGRGGASCWRRS